MSVGGTIAVACALALLLALFFGWLARRSFKKFEREAELNAPLIESEDRRVDAALRDAEDGYNVCAVCEFENFKRFRFCALCKAPIADEKGDKGEQQGGNNGSNVGGKGTSTKTSLLSIFKREHHLELASSSFSVPPIQSTRRRLRVQRRKEWVRKLDVEGRAYWFRDNGFAGVDTLSAAFVVSFQPATDKLDDVEKPEQPPSLSNTRKKNTDPLPTIVTETRISHHSYAIGDDPGNSNISEPEHSPGNGGFVPSRSRRQRSPIQSVDERVLGLSRIAARAVLKPASDVTADASKLPLNIQIGLNARTLFTAHRTMSTPLTETMAFASKDFPSKYAHFVMAASALLVPTEREHLRLNVNRASVFKDSLESLAIIPLRNVHSTLRIHFLDENGLDAGGLHREWFVMLNEAIVDPARGLFICSNKSEQTYFLSPCSNADVLPDQLLHLYATGRLLGRALLDGSMLCFHLAPPMIKLMLGYPVSFSDLEDLDPEVHVSLRWLLENDNADSLGLDFTVTVKDGENYQCVDLVPGGSAIPVTDSNKCEFVERKWQYLLVESIAPQLQVFLRGLYEIVPRELLLLFDPEEFDFLLCGSDEIDVDDWERNTKYSEDLHHHRALQWFWELVREMPNEYRRRLLQFSTGSSRVPLGGFGALTSYDGRLCPFTLKSVSLVGDGFIHSHACFNRLDLPLHVVREELKAVLYAMLETEVYGFTTD